MNAAGAGARNSSVVLLAVAMLAIGLDVGVARITYGVVLPAFSRTGSGYRPSAGSPPRFMAQACLPPPPTDSSARRTQK